MNIWKNHTWGVMLLKEIDEPFNSNDYIFEMKYDGIRALCFTDGSSIKFISRNQNDLTSSFPELASIKKITKSPIILDGEIVLLDEKGFPNFSSLLKRNRLKDKEKIKILSTTNPVIYIAFDILYQNKSLIDKPLMERKKYLDTYPDTDQFIKAKYIEKEGKKLFKEIKKLNLEGIVAKRKDGKYHINKRTYDFIKIKNIKRDKFIIGGYEIKKQNITIYLGSEINGSLSFVGKCSLSLNHPDANKILKLSKAKNSFYNLDEDITYTKLNLKCFIDYTEKTNNNHLRHPVFKGLV